MLNISKAMIVNISKDKIYVDYDFKGDKIAVFGKKEARGNLAVILKSQKLSYKVYNRQKLFGIWTNSNPRTFKDIYNIYKLQTESGLTINREDGLREFEIGIKNINFYNFASVSSVLNTAEYKEAFLRQKAKTKDYMEEFGKIEGFQNSDLFYTEIEIPPDIKQGKYLIEVMLLENERIKEFQVFQISVEHTGIIKKIKTLSVKHKILYILLSIGLSIGIAFLSYMAAKILYYNRRR